MHSALMHSAEVDSRETDLESGSARWGLEAPDGAAMAGDDLHDDGQTEAAASDRAGPSVVEAGKALEDARSLLGRHSGAIVVHPEHRMLGCAAPRSGRCHRGRWAGARVARLPRRRARGAAGCRPCAASAGPRRAPPPAGSGHRVTQGEPARPRADDGCWRSGCGAHGRHRTRTAAGDHGLAAVVRAHDRVIGVLACHPEAVGAVKGHIHGEAVCLEAARE